MQTEKDYIQAEREKLQAATNLTQTTQVKAIAVHPMAQEIFEYDDISEESMNIPEWGNKEILIRSLTVKESAKFLTDFQGLNTGHLEPVMYLVIRGVCDPVSKERIFLDNIATRQMLSKRNPTAMGNISRVVMKISGLGTRSQADAEKN